jgi:stage II sporulation protein D
MVRATAAAPLLCLLLAAGSGARAADRGTAPPAPANAVFSISGRGWGHGVGMSQYGALGFAQHGWSYRRIVGHYFRGTQLGRAPTSRVRVLLADGRTALKVGSTQAFRVRDGSGATHDVEPGGYSLGSGLKLAVDGEKAKALPGPLLFTPRTAPLSLDGRLYRGQLELVLVQGRLRVIDHVPLDAYLLGVVPREVPYQWPAEALKAQAVVARSYALAVRKSGPFDLYPDTRSQVYGGVAAERPETTAAVNSTAGEVVLYAGRVATTYFFSTSGGRTASVGDVWPGTTPIPYLVSVPDPYDSLSPYHRWGPLPLAPSRLAKALHARGALVDVRATLNASGRVDTLTGVTASGESSATGSALRTALGLRSTWFQVGVLSLGRPAPAAVVYGKAAHLGGRARGLAGVVLEARPPHGAWQRAAQVRGGSDGTFTLALKPKAATEYRLASGTVRTASVRVAVTPDVRLALPDGPTELAGRVRPAVEGAIAVIQRRVGSTWRIVGRAAVDGQGRFRARLNLTPGTYRARVAPGGGLAPGVSPPLDVVGS